MATNPLGAQISHMLKDRGVDVIFGIPGVHNQEMYRGIEEAGLTHILARHEQGAGFMADGYARATGRVGVCYVITGPGLCNIMTPMGQAYSDSVSMLVLSSCLDETSMTRGQLHQMRDQSGAARAVCEWSETARTVGAAYGLIDRALYEFASKRPRPKQICLPIGLLEADADGFPDTIGMITKPYSALDAEISGLAGRLMQSKRPLFIFGGGAKGVSEPAAMLSRLNAASMTTYAGRGIVAPDTPLFLGSNLARPSSADVIAKADLVVAWGTELSEVDLWRDALGHTGTLVRVDIDLEVLADRHRADQIILGDCAEVFDRLSETLTVNQSSDWSQADITAQRETWKAEIAVERPGILPAAQALQSALPDNTLIYSDMTQFAYAAKEVWDMPAPGLWHHPSGFGTLGYALPAAIGGKIGRPDQPVIAIAGDYGFQYTIQELIVAVEHSLSLPIILWDNGKLGEIEASMIASQIAPNAVIQKNPDFIALARAYGAATAQPQELSQLSEVLNDALAYPGPTVIHLQAGIAYSV